MKTIVIKGADFSANALGKTIIPNTPLNWKYNLAREDFANITQNVYNRIPPGLTTAACVASYVPALEGSKVNAIKCIFSNSPMPSYGEEEKNLNIPSTELLYGVFYGELRKSAPTIPLTTFRLSQMDIAAQERIVRIPETTIEANHVILIGAVNYDGSTGMISKVNAFSLPLLFVNTFGDYQNRISCVNGTVDLSNGENALLMDFSIVK